MQFLASLFPSNSQLVSDIPSAPLLASLPELRGLLAGIFFGRCSRLAGGILHYLIAVVACMLVVLMLQFEGMLAITVVSYRRRPTA